MMNKRITLAGLILVLTAIVGIVFAAARPTTPLPSPTTTLRPTNTVTMVVAQSIVTPTDMPIPTSTATPARDFDIASIAHSVTIAPPQVVSTPIPTYPLTTRRPTLEELELYLVENKVHSSSIDCVRCSAPFVIPSLSPQAELIYVDLNNDEEDDLIVSDRVPNSFLGPLAFVVVLLWQENQYAEPLTILSVSKYSSYQQVLISDWTGDHVPELIVDQTADHGGAGFYMVTWTRYIIHCDIACHVVWSGQTDYLDNFSVASTFVQAQFNQFVDESALPTFTVSYGSFQTSIHREGNYRSQVKVNPETVERWVWNGAAFILASEQTLAEEYEINFQPVLSATNGIGIQAVVQAKPDTVSRANGFAFDICTLLVNGLIVDESFACDANLTWVSWQDVNADGNDEVVVIAYTKLIMEQMLVYDWDGANAYLLAEVAGQVIRPDLYGVRLENIDEDSALEILTGNYELAGSNCRMVENPVTQSGSVEDCWYAELVFFDTWYDWNGATYVDRGRVP